MHSIFTQFFSEHAKPAHVLFGVDSLLSHLEVFYLAFYVDSAKSGTVAYVQKLLVDLDVVPLASKGLTRYGPFCEASLVCEQNLLLLFQSFL